MKMKELQFPIKITITEEDWLKAEPYSSTRDCIVATACKRVLGVNDVSVDAFDIDVLEDNLWVTLGLFSEHLGCEWTKNNDSEIGPFYDKSVVGKSFEIIKP